MAGFYVDAVENYKVIGYYAQDKPDAVAITCDEVPKMAGECVPGSSIVANQPVSLQYHDLVDAPGLLTAQSTSACDTLGQPPCNAQRLLNLLSPPTWQFTPGQYLLLSVFRTRQGAEEFAELARDRGATLTVVLASKLGGPYVGLGQEAHPDGIPVPCSIRSEIRISTSGRRAVRLIATLLLLGAGGCSEPVPSTSVAPATRLPTAALAASLDGATCPEIEATALPIDLRVTDRMVVPSGLAPAGVRVQYTTVGGRELTLLSGVAGEIPRGRAVRQITIRGHSADLSFSASDAFVIRWLEAAEGAPCSQYAVVAARLSATEIDAILAGIR